MAVVEVATVAKMLTSALAKPAVERAKRQEAIVKILHRAGVAAKNPPPEFDGLYVYAYVEYCYGKIEPIARLFQNQYVREAYKRSFESDDPAFLDREVAEVLQWNEETGELGRIDYNLAREVAGFSVVFHRLVDRTRSAAQTRVENKVDRIGSGVDDLQDTIERLVDRLDRLHSREEIVRHELPSLTALQRLANDVRDWFAAVEYPIVKELAGQHDCFAWLVKVPARRGYDLTLVYGQDGELEAPDVAHARQLGDSLDAVETWVLAPSRISPAARRLDEADDKVYCYTFDELIDERADFEPYLMWLEQAVERQQIADRYVAMSCRKDEADRQTGKIGAHSRYDWSDGGLDEYVERWLEDDSKEHLSILGEFGMGKTWFTLHFAYRLAQRWKEAKRLGKKRPRLPLVIPLRDYAKAVSVESLFSEFFFRKHEILPDGYRVFDALNRLGKLLLIFDGFDEMAARIDRQAMINNFWELARAVVPGSKVLLTCRTEHFPEAQEGRNLLGAKLKASTSALTGEPPQFEVVELLAFDDDQVRSLLGHITDQPTTDTIMAHDQIRDLMRRPVMGELVLAALPAIEAGAAVDTPRVYLYAVREKIKNDIKSERTFTSLADKVYFLCELSWHMLSNDVMSLNYRDFPDRIRECFGEAVAEQRDLDHWHYDMLGQTMLVRNADGDYSPAHRSLIEFFVAYKFAAELGCMNADFRTLVGTSQGTEAGEAAWSDLITHTRRTGATPEAWRREPMPRLRKGFGSTELSIAVCQMMVPMLGPAATHQLLDAIRDTRDRTADEVGVTGGNAATLLVKIAPEGLRGADLRATNITGANLDVHPHADLSGSDLSLCRLDSSNLANVIFSESRLAGASVRDCWNFGTEGSRITKIVATARQQIFLIDSIGSLYQIGSDLQITPIPTPFPVSDVSDIDENRTLCARGGQPAFLLDDNGAQIPVHGWAVEPMKWNGRFALVHFLGAYPNHQILVTDFATGQEITRHEFPTHEWGTVTMPDVSRIALLSTDMSDVSVQILSAAPDDSVQSSIVASFKLTGFFDFNQLSLDDNKIYATEILTTTDNRSGSKGRKVMINEVDLQTGEVRNHIRGPIEPESLYIRPSGSTVGGGIVVIYRHSRLEAFDLSRPGPRIWTARTPSQITGCVCVPDWNAVILSTETCEVRVLDLTTGVLRKSWRTSRNFKGTRLAGITGVDPEWIEELVANGATVDPD
jgi:hypothetical protein